MRGRGVVVTAVLLAVSIAIWSWAATIWQLQTRLSNAGGNIKVRNQALQTTVGVTVFTNFTTSAPVPVTVTANPGYKISSLNRSGTLLPIGNYTTHYITTFQKSGGSPQSLVAGFAAQAQTITATVVGPGTISPTSVTVPYNGSATFTANPAANGAYLVSVSGGTYTDLNNAAITLPYPGAVKITASNVTSPRTVTATYTTFSVNAGPNQVGMVQSAVTLTGSMTGGGTPSWTQVSGPATTLTGAATLSASFVPTTSGTYVFQLAEYQGSTQVASATTQVQVVQSVTEYMRITCMGCHSDTGVYPRGASFRGWSASRHKVVGINCISCHTDGPMPTPVNSHVISSQTFSYFDGSGNFCLNGTCHNPGLVHKTPGMVCANCHGDYSGHLPDKTFLQVANACFSCHGGVNTTHYYSKTSLAPDQCRLCHNQSGHNPLPFASVPRVHFNGYTSYKNPNYAAAYVTPATQCADCHVAGDPSTPADTALLQYRTDWAASKHGSTTDAPWANSASHNWKASGTAGANAKKSASIATDCLRCHSAAGYLQFALYTSFAPVASTSDKYSEPLTCNACHVSGDFSAPRSIGPRTGYYNYSSRLTGRLNVTQVYPDVQRSNICLGCHVGREAGDTIKAIAQATAHQAYSTSFWQNLGFINSHYLTAGGQVFGTTGYEYPGFSYRNGGVDHSLVGTGTPQGPCVACHLPNSSHTLNPAQAAYALCNGCHRDGGTITPAFMEQQSANFQAGLKALAAALTQKGFTPSLDANGAPVYPYFTARNWGNEATAPGNMGAAFNYNLLAHDPGAFAHNPTYTKRLLRDSIDYLVYGEVDRNRDLTSTINGLLSNSTDQNNAKSLFTNAANGSAACAVCHSDAVDPLTGHNIVADYQLSIHASRPNGASCVSCHAPTDPVAHPHATMLTATADINLKCTGCHIPPVHSWPSYGLCSNCHNGHDPTPRLPAPHLANFSTAQYITANLSCDNCHYANDDRNDPLQLSFNIWTANRQWAKSGKADPKSPAYVTYDFKTLGSKGTPATSAGNDCVRCHTTTGYVNYVTSNFTDIHAWGTSGLAPGGDRKREMIACPACHTPTPFKSYDSLQTDMWGEPLQPAFSRRSVDAVPAYYNYSSDKTGRILLGASAIPDMGISNNCMVCHSGTVAGSTLKAISTKMGGASASFWNATPFIDGHGMGAAGIMFSTTGYHFPVTRTRTYQPSLSFTHDSIDAPYYGGQGACVACHLYTEKPHLFSPVSSASNGTITKIGAFYDVCSQCHDGGVQPIDLNNPANLDAKKQGFKSSLKALAAVFATKGIYFNPAKAPYFFNVKESALQGPASSYYTAWNALNAAAPAIYSGEALMGAAFDLRLLWSENGAYAHNDVYTKKLIYDAIDLLDNGLLDNSVSSTVGALSTAEASFTDADKTRAIGYVGVRPR